MANSKAEQLADFIEAHPNCQFDIDNDCWYMMKPDSERTNDEDGSDQLTSSEDYLYKTDWYSGSNNYGAGIAEALIILLNRRGFNIKAAAV